MAGNIERAPRLDQNDFRGKIPRLQMDATKANTVIVDLSNRGFCIKAYIVPIPGTTKLSRFEENISAAKLLFQPKMKPIEQTSSAIQSVGALSRGSFEKDSRVIFI